MVKLIFSKFLKTQSGFLFEYSSIKLVFLAEETTRVLSKDKLNFVAEAGNFSNKSLIKKGKLSGLSIHDRVSI